MTTSTGVDGGPPSTATVTVSALPSKPPRASTRTWTVAVAPASSGPNVHDAVPFAPSSVAHAPGLPCTTADSRSTAGAPVTTTCTSPAAASPVFVTTTVSTPRPRSRGSSPGTSSSTRGGRGGTTSTTTSTGGTSPTRTS